MKLLIPDGMAPAAAVDQAARQFLCRGCAGRSARVVLVADSHPCVECGGAITVVVQPSKTPSSRQPSGGARR